MDSNYNSHNGMPINHNSGYLIHSDEKSPINYSSNYHLNFNHYLGGNGGASVKNLGNNQSTNNFSDNFEHSNK